MLCLSTRADVRVVSPWRSSRCRRDPAECQHRHADLRAPWAAPSPVRQVAQNETTWGTVYTWSSDQPTPRSSHDSDRKHDERGRHSPVAAVELSFRAFVGELLEIGSFRIRDDPAIPRRIDKRI